MSALPSGCEPVAVTVAVTVNGQRHRIAHGASVAALLAQMGHAPQSVAVAVNAQFVPRSLHAGHALHEGDEVTCFQPIVGG
jgi:sulfur carrier protein